MPTYEYACRGCGEHVEVVQSFKDEPLTTCGLCGGSLRKVFSAAGIVFKGSGYYVTDSRKKATAESKKREQAKGEGHKSESGAKNGRDAKTDSTKTEGTGKAESA